MIPPPIFPTETQPSALVRRLVQLAYGENRANPDPEEVRAIVGTVLERPNLHGYPDNPLDVLAQPKQYSPFNPTDPNYPVVNAFDESHPDWARFETMVKDALAKPRTDFTHYFTGKPPAWAEAMSGLTRIGSHTFGRENRRKKKGR